MALQEIKIIGEAYFHKFKMNDGSIVEVETSPQDYAQLAIGRPVNPQITGGTWIGSYSNNKYDTPNNKLAIGQCAFQDGVYVTDTGGVGLLRFASAPTISKLEAKLV